MALTYSVVQSTVMGNKRIVFASITLDNNYPAGGYVLSASGLGLTSLDWMLPGFPGVEFNPATGKLKVFSSLSPFTEYVGGSDLAAVVVPVEAIGT